MSRPLLEVADLVRSAGVAFIERNQAWLRWDNRRYVRMVAGACNHPNVPSIHFSFTIQPNHLRWEAPGQMG